MTLETTALPVRADGTDQHLLESVLAFYHNRFKDESSGSKFLLGRGLSSPELLNTFQIGYADRELGRRLPSRQNRSGRELRDRLKQLGVYRDSGHGHFNGSLVVPLQDAAGQIVNIYGRKTTAHLKDTCHLHTWLREELRGVFNGQVLPTCTELILTDSILNALAFWCAELRNVTCTFGLIQMHNDLVSAIKESPIKRVYLAQRCTAEGDSASVQAGNVLAAMNIELLRIKFPHDHDANDFLLAEGPGELGTLLKAAQPHTATSSTVVVPTTAQEPVQEQVKPVTPKAATLPDGEPTITETDIRFTFDDRHYRVRGLDKNNSLQRLKINLLVERRELVHVDSLELYSAQARSRFIKQASTEIYVDEQTLKQELAKILLKLEGLQEDQLRAKLTVQQEQPKPLSDQERSAALQLLKDPNLLDRILADYDRCGLVGEETNKLVCYLGCVSRLLDRPLAIMVQSSSAAGKTTLMDAALSFVPPEHQIRYSAMTGQSLYYMGPDKNMKHKILAVSEEEGVAQASYALKLLQSDGKLKIAAAGKNSDTGRQQTEEYEVEGPVMMFLTTTSEMPDPELQNRCIILRVNESAIQTAAIHARQGARYTLAGQQGLADREAICQLHQNAQRLLEPKRVLIPWANQFTFRHDQTRMRRDFEKYLSLIATITLLHQCQREQQGDSIIATLADVELANRLAGEALGQSLDDLLPQTRQLLVLIDDHITSRAHEEQKRRSDLRFTQRQIREALGWSDRSLRRHLLRLVELEYVLAYRTGQGSRREYQLLYDGQGREGERFLLGLIDVNTLQPTPHKGRTGGQNGPAGTRPAPNRRPTGTHPAAPPNDTNDSPVNDLPHSRGNQTQNGQATHDELIAS